MREIMLRVQLHERMGKAAVSDRDKFGAANAHPGTGLMSIDVEESMAPIEFNHPARTRRRLIPGAGDGTPKFRSAALRFFVLDHQETGKEGEPHFFETE
jgi:hypothetical protein